MTENLNLVHFRQFNPEEAIEKFIKVKAKSENSKVNYRIDIKQFFKMIKGKEINFLTDKDFIISLKNFEDFISKLQEKGIGDRSINRKVSSVKGLFRYLQPRVEDFNINTEINIEFFKSVEIPKFNEEDGSYDALTEEEVELMAELALEDRIKPKEKRLFLLFALDTGLRKEEIKSVKWSDFLPQDNGTYSFRVKGKGDKWHHRSMTQEFFNELNTIKNEREDLVFSLTDGEIRGLIKKSIERVSIHESRKIVLHSIRKTAITSYYYLSGGDIIATQEYAGHSKIETTRNYIKAKKRNFLGAYSSKKALDKETLYSSSKEELLELIKSIPEIEIQLLLKAQNKEV